MRRYYSEDPSISRWWYKSERTISEMKRNLRAVTDIKYYSDDVKWFIEQALHPVGKYWNNEGNIDKTILTTAVIHSILRISGKDLDGMYSRLYGYNKRGELFL